MKTLKQYEDSERLVKLVEWDGGTFSATIITKDKKSTGSNVYTRRNWAERKFMEYKNHPLKTIKGL